MHLLTAALLSLLALPVTTICSPPTATTLNGTYAGRHLPEFSQDLFLGIPFAGAPRLRESVPYDESWTGTRDATRYTVSCWAVFHPPALAATGAVIGEDCLNLNIIRPAGTLPSAALPVVVWIYGGGFIGGFGGDSNTNTSYLVRDSVENGTPILAVTINYRLGFFGFPGGKQIVAEGETNLGLKDQRHALRWLRENIASFGGDPDKVTLWGQSAGAISVGHQILAHDGRGAEGLFRGGIMVSGSPGFVSNAMFPTHPNALLAYDELANVTGCADADHTLDCIREAPADLVWNTTVKYSPVWWPNIDGDFVRRSPALQLRDGAVAPVSVIIGANNDEGLISANSIAANAQTDDDVAAILRGVFPAARESTIQKVLAAYPVTAPDLPPLSVPVEADPANDAFCEALREADMACGPQYRRVAAMLGDFVQAQGRRQVVETWAAAGIPAWSYRFDTNPTDIPIVKNALAPGFSTHSSEYAYFFNFPPEYDMLGLNPPVRNVSSHLTLSRNIADKLIAYIVTGDPNSFTVPTVPEWPVYSLKDPKNMVFNATYSDNKINTRVEADSWRKEEVKLWTQYAVELSYGSDWRP